MFGGLQDLLYKSSQLLQTPKTSAWNQIDNVHQMEGDPFEDDVPVSVNDCQSTNADQYLISSIRGSVPVHSTSATSPHDSQHIIDSPPLGGGSPDLQITEVRKIKQPTPARGHPRTKTKQKQGGLGNRYIPVQVSPPKTEPIGMNPSDHTFRNVEFPTNPSFVPQGMSMIDPQLWNTEVPTSLDSVSQGMDLADPSLGSVNFPPNLGPVPQGIDLIDPALRGVESPSQVINTKVPVANMKRMAEPQDNNIYKRHKPNIQRFVSFFSPNPTKPPLTPTFKLKLDPTQAKTGFSVHHQQEEDIKPQLPTSSPPPSLPQRNTYRPWETEDYTNLASSISHHFDYFGFAHYHNRDPDDVRHAFNNLIKTPTPECTFEPFPCSDVRRRIELNLYRYFRDEGWTSPGGVNYIVAKAFAAGVADARAADTAAALSSGGAIISGGVGIRGGAPIIAGFGAPGTPTTSTSGAANTSTTDTPKPKSSKQKSVKEYEREMFSSMTLFQQAVRDRAEKRRAKKSEKDGSGVAGGKKLGRPKKGDGFGGGKGADFA